MDKTLPNEWGVVDNVKDIADQVFAGTLSLEDAKAAVVGLVPLALEDELEQLRVLSHQTDRKEFVFEAYGWVWIRS